VTTTVSEERSQETGADVPLSPAITNSEVVLFTGAGASVPLGLPTTESFLQDLAKEVQTDSGAQSIYLAAVDELGSQANIERLLDLIAAWGADPPKIPRRLVDRRITGFAPEVVASRIPRLEQAALRLITARYSDVDAERAYFLYLWLFFFLKSFAERWCPLPIFTTNYDWTFERVAERLKKRLNNVIDGFVMRPMGNVWDPGVFHRLKGGRTWQLPLFKLHGSTSWYRQTSRSVIKMMHAERDPGQLKNVLIYPTQSKSSLVLEDPFRTAYEYLSACLRTGARLCLVIGYSFRDPEISAAFRIALVDNRRLELIILNPTPDKDRIIADLQDSSGRITFIEDEFQYYGIDLNSKLRDAIVDRATPNSILMRKP